MPTWLSDANANRHIKTYVKDFLDVSGNLTVRNNDEDYKWNTYGQVLSGPYESDNDVQFGIIVSMDASGTTIAVGAHADNTTGANGVVRAYKYDSNAEMWYQFGNSIYESGTTDFGRTLDMSDDGSRIAVSDPNINKAWVYDYNPTTNNWDNADPNNTINDESYNISNDPGVTLSGDGNTLFLSYVSINSSAGIVYMYRNTSGNTWDYVGSVGNFRYGDVNRIIAISYDGNRFVVGAPGYDPTTAGGGAQDGLIRTYNYTSGSLSHTNHQMSYMLGLNETGLNGSYYGDTGDMTPDGTVLAVGARVKDRVLVYNYDETSSTGWKQKGSTIVGPSNNDFGSSIRLSSDGNILAIGEMGNDDVAVDSGAIYIYKFVNGDWEQQGETNYAIYGYGVGYMGRMIGLGLSADGSKVVAGGYHFDANTTNSGVVQAWQWSKKAPYTNPILDVSGGVLTVWGGAEENNSQGYIITQIGSTLSGNTNSSFGEDVKLNANGSVVVIGASGENGMYVYKYRNDIWSQIGSKIAHSSYSGQGERVVINDDGTIVSTGTNSNAMNVWEFTNGDWSLKGSTITNGSGTIYFGNRGNAMNGAGNRVAGKSNSFIAAYEYNNGDWVQMGSNITDSDYFDTGYTNQLAMNKAGDILAIGMPGYDQPNTNTGRVAIYKFTGDISDGSWNQLGNYITPPSSGNNEDYIGISVSLSDDGYTVAFSTPHFGANDDMGRGFVYKYSEIGNRWDPYGPEIKQADVFRETSFTTTRFASGISISGDGKTLAISDHNGGQTSTNITGLLHIMKYIDGKWTWIGRLGGTDHGDYWATMCSISRDGTHCAGSATLFNSSYVGEVKVGKITNTPPIKIDKDGVSLDSLFNADNVILQCPTLKGIGGATADYETFWGRNPGVGDWRTSFDQQNAGYLYIDNDYSSNFDLLLTGMYTGGGGIHRRGYDLASRSGGALNFQIRITQGGTNEDFSLGINTTAYYYRLYVGGSAWSSGSYYSSDDRIKHNETPLTNALETIRKLHPQHYIKTLKMYDADHQLDLDASGNPLDASGNPMPVSEYMREDGFIAQEVNEIPELKYAFNESLDEDMPHGLDYTSIFTTAVKALQELDELDGQRQTKLSSLQARIDALENK